METRSAKTVDASRHQCFCELLHIQTLRSHFDGKMRARKAHAGCNAKIFAVCYAPCVCTNFKQNETAKVFAKLLPVQQPDGGYPAGDAREAPEGTAGLIFFGPFFVQRQRKDTKTKPRARTKCSVSVCRRSCSKYHQISPKKSSFCPFCRLTYIILYAIIYPVSFFFPNITFFETTYGKILWPARRGNIRPDAASAHDTSVCLFAFYEIFCRRGNTPRTAL